jgi:glutathione synthase
MVGHQDPPYPPDLEVVELERLLDVVEDWTIAHGLAVRPSPAVVDTEPSVSRILATSAPVTLFPSPFPRACFEEARRVQRPYNELYARVSRDDAYLAKVVTE